MPRDTARAPVGRGAPRPPATAPRVGALRRGVALCVCLLAASRCAVAADGRGEWKPERWQEPGVRFWAPGDLEEGVATKHLHAWRPLVDKLLSGRAVTFLTFGSSITEGSHGHWFSSRAALRSLGQHTLSYSQRYFCKASGDGACVHEGTLTDLMAYINATWPHANHTLINLGRAGSDLGGLARNGCFDAYLPAEADLLFLQSHVDDALCNQCDEREQAGVAAAEQLYRLVLRKLRPGPAPPPAVLLSYLWVTDPTDDVQSWHMGVKREHACDYFAEHNSTFQHRLSSSMSGVTAEDRLSTAAAFYGWTALSLRNAIWAGLRDGAAQRMNLSDCEFVSLYYNDQIHPSRAGVHYLGDVLVSLLKEAVARFGGNATDARADAYTLPAATMLPGASAARERMCLPATDLEPAVNHGWTLVLEEEVFDHATNTSRMVPKPGLIATEPGSSVRLLVNTRFPHTAEAAPVALTVQYLRSYEHMGNAVLTCVHRCECEPQLLNGTHAVKVSTETAATFNITQSRHCAVQLTVADATDSGEHKVKFLGFSVETLPE